MAWEPIRVVLILLQRVHGDYEEILVHYDVLEILQRAMAAPRDKDDLFDDQLRQRQTMPMRPMIAAMVSFLIGLVSRVFMNASEIAFWKDGSLYLSPNTYACVSAIQ